MSLTTFSSFFYGHTVTNQNNSIDFSEGGGPEIQATLNPGDYTLTEFIAEIKRAMDSVGALVYTVTVNRTTRIIQITAPSNFSLLTGTGSRLGSGAWTLMGITTGTNIVNQTTVTGNFASGSIYRSQSLLVGYTQPENFLEKTDAVVNESASGRVQVITFGTTNFIDLEIRFATDLIMPSCQMEIETQASGVANLRSFMNYIVSKAKFEFMPNRDLPNNYYKVILEKTELSSKGTAYKLEKINNAPGFFNSGKLVLRVVT